MSAHVYEKERRRQNYCEKQSALSTLKLESGCVDCGYREHPEALDFDHARGEKRFTIDRWLTTGSISTILDELEKCDVVCANCHRVRTHNRRG